MNNNPIQWDQISFRLNTRVRAMEHPCFGHYNYANHLAFHSFHEQSATLSLNCGDCENCEIAYFAVVVPYYHGLMPDPDNF